MSKVLSGGDNTITGSIFSSYAANNCTIREQMSSDNWLAPVMSEVFGSNQITEKEGRYYLEPVSAYGNVNLQEALTNFESYNMPDCFKWAKVDLSVDLFGNKRAATTYRGAYDPNATKGSSAIESVFAADGTQLTVRALGNGEYTIEGAEGTASVYDMSGRLVFNGELTDGNLSLANAAAGIYVVRVAGGAAKVIR